MDAFHSVGYSGTQVVVKGKRVWDVLYTSFDPFHHLYLPQTIKAITSSHQKVSLKEYYEIVGESRPLSGCVPTHADLFTEMHF